MAVFTAGFTIYNSPIRLLFLLSTVRVRRAIPAAVPAPAIPDPDPRRWKKGKGRGKGRGRGKGKGKGNEEDRVLPPLYYGAMPYYYGKKPEASVEVVTAQDVIVAANQINKGI